MWLWDLFSVQTDMWASLGDIYFAHSQTWTSVPTHLWAGIWWAWAQSRSSSLSTSMDRCYSTMATGGLLWAWSVALPPAQTSPLYTQDAGCCRLTSACIWKVGPTVLSLGGLWTCTFQNIAVFHRLNLCDYPSHCCAWFHCSWNARLRGGSGLQGYSAPCTKDHNPTEAQ